MSNGGATLKVTNSDGSYTQIDGNTSVVDGTGRIAEYLVTQFGFDQLGALMLTRTVTFGQCSDTYPNWHLCVTGTTDKTANASAVEQVTTTYTSGVPSTSTLSIGNVSMLSYGAAGGASSATTCFDCAKEVTLQGIRSDMQTSMSGTVAADAIGTRNVDLSTFGFNTFSFTGTAACPAPRTFTLQNGGQLIAVSWQPFCDFVGWFRPVALAVSLFIAGMIMLGQRSSDSGG